MSDAPEAESFEKPENVWLRGLWMLIIAALMRVAGIVLLVMAILQFGWMLFGKQTNGHIAGFGEKLARWFAKAARFQSGARDDKPFPWTKWE